jgi:hypothetical protein
LHTQCLIMAPGFISKTIEFAKMMTYSPHAHT